MSKIRGQAPIPRLRICALLAPVTEEEFSTLRKLMQTTDSAPSKQLATLADAGYVGQRRAARDRRSRVWVALTDSGRRTFRHHLQALTALADSPQEGPYRP